MAKVINASEFKDLVLDSKGIVLVDFFRDMVRTLQGSRADTGKTGA